MGKTARRGEAERGKTGGVGAERPGASAGDARRESIRRLALASMLSAVALVLSYLETMIPLPVSVPGIKLGLANVAVAVALFTTDTRTAAAVALVKVLATGLLFGSPMMLAYSLGGTALSFCGMALLALVPGIGLVPVCMAGAILHNVGQLGVAAWMLGTPSVFVSLPVLAIAACVTGSVTGVVAQAALSSLEGAGSEGDRPAPGRVPELACGEHLALVGVNGSGKTTLALEIARRLGGEAGIALQDPDSQIVAPVVRDDVAFGPENRGVPRDEMLRAVREALEEVGLAEAEGREVDTLSGGQRQRVAVAGLLALAPGTVIFDETTSMLDPLARERFARMVRRLTGQGIAVVQVTQLMDEAFMADRVAVLAEGEVVADATPADLLARPEVLVGSGLELPRVARLAASLRAQGIDVPLTNDIDELEEACACLGARA